MSRLIPSLLAVVLLPVGCAAPSDTGGADEATVTRPELRIADLQRTVTTAHDKFVALATAMPAEDLTWRPMDGVRSVSEVYAHVAADNYYVPALMGWEAPPETGITSDVATFRTFQDRQRSRDETLETLDASFSFFLSAMAETGGDLDREVMLGGSPTTVGDVWIRAVTHLHEHLGQSIAYARANEVVPPWSR